MTPAERLVLLLVADLALLDGEGWSDDAPQRKPVLARLRAARAELDAEAYRTLTREAPE